MAKLFLGFVLLGSLLWGQITKPSPAERNALQEGSLSNAIFEPPSPSKGLVFDYGNVLSSDEVATLNQNLIAYNDSTSTQIVIVTVKDLNGFPLENTAARIGEAWGVGQAEEDNGCVILLSKDDRQITIQGGYGFQAKVPATLSKIIIDRHITPEFKQGDYFAGLRNGTAAIFSVLAGEYQANASDGSGFGGEVVFVIFFIAFVIFLIFFFVVSKSSGGGKGGKRYRRSSWEDIIISGTGASNWGDGGSSWGGGGSSGGFGGFGGGSFGGGGASGSW